MSSSTRITGEFLNAVALGQVTPGPVVSTPPAAGLLGTVIALAGGPLP